MKHLFTLCFLLVALMCSGQTQDENPVYQLIEDYPISDSIYLGEELDTGWLVTIPEPTIEMRHDTAMGLVVYVKGKRVKVDYGWEVTTTITKVYEYFGMDERTYVTQHLVGKKKEPRWNIVKFISHEIN